MLNLADSISEPNTEPEERNPQDPPGLDAVAPAVALAFVGSVVPDEAQYRDAAFNAAGQMFQRELLLGLKNAGLPASLVISAIPVPSRRHRKDGYPQAQRWFVRGERTKLFFETPIHLVPFINITPLKQLLVGLVTALELLRWGFQNRATEHRLVYAYNLSVPPGIFVYVAARMIGAKTLVSLCDIDVPGETVPKGLYWKFDHWMQRKLSAHFDGHTVVAQAIADDFLPGKDCLRLEGGISPEILATARRELALRAPRAQLEPFIIVAAGQLSETNGFPVLLQAFELLSGNNFRLRIAGSGPLEQQVRDAAAKDHRIEYLGRLSFDQVLETYASADVLINLRVTRSRNTKYFFHPK